MVNIENQFQPDYVSLPGDTLLEVLETIGMSQADLAKRMGRPRKTINEIIQGKAAITPETALQLELVLNIPASFWNNREQQYRETLARIELEETLEDQVKWLRDMPIAPMCKHRWIDQQQDTVGQLRETLRFFGVASVSQYHTTYTNLPLAFRQAASGTESKGAVMAWLRKGEIEAQNILCAPYNLAMFKAALREIKGFTREPLESRLIQMQRLCAEAGVAFVLERALPNTGISGVARWLNPKKALIQLSLRYKSDDQFWFSFFHESAHVVKHGKSKLYLSVDGQDTNELEQEANQIAGDWLIPPKEYRKFVTRYKSKTKHVSKSSVTRFADLIGISPGIIVGRLQHDGVIPMRNLNGLKRQLTWGNDGSVKTTRKEW